MKFFQRQKDRRRFKGTLSNGAYLRLRAEFERMPKTSVLLVVGVGDGRLAEMSAAVTGGTVFVHCSNGPKFYCSEAFKRLVVAGSPVVKQLNFLRKTEETLMKEWTIALDGFIAEVTGLEQKTAMLKALAPHVKRGGLVAIVFRNADDNTDEIEAASPVVEILSHYRCYPDAVVGNRL